MTKKAWQFVLLTFLFSWTPVFLFKALGGKWNTTGAFIAVSIYMFTPALAAILVQRVFYKEKIREFDISFKLNRWFIIAWLFPAALALITAAFTLLLPGIRYSVETSRFLDIVKASVPAERFEQLSGMIAASPHIIIWASLIQALIAGITVNAVFGFGEELGWRGLLQKETIHMGFWKSSLLIGFIWGAWHAPLILEGLNYPDHPAIGVFMMIAWCMLLAPIFSYVRLKAKSVIAAVVIHGSLNASAGIAIIMIKGGNDLTTGLTGLPGFIILLMVNLFLAGYAKDPAREVPKNN